VPSCGVHTVVCAISLDLIYLDENHQVIHLIEHFPRFRILPLRTQAVERVGAADSHHLYVTDSAGRSIADLSVEEIANRFNKETSDNSKSDSKAGHRLG